MRLLFFSLLLTLLSCSTEEQKEQLILNEANSITTSKATARPCPTPASITLSSQSDWYDLLFGEGDGYGEQDNGLWDYILNCPRIPQTSDCILICDVETVYFEGSSNWPLELCSGDPVFADGIFSAQEQQAFIDQLINIATTNAPTCPNSMVQMQPINYDVYWNSIGLCIVVGMKVKYMPPCRYEAG